MRTLFVLNDAPYGTERTYNGLRLAASLATREGEEVRVFLMGDAAASAKSGQRVPRGSCNMESLLQLVLTHGGEVAACGTCMDARGIAAEELTDGVAKRSLQELTDWIQDTDRTITY